MMVDTDLRNVNSVEMVFAGSCNLKCSYCVIHKEPKRMHEYNNNIRKSVLDGTFQKNLFNLFKETKDNVYALSIWSGEPTLNADIADKLLIPVFDFFKNADEFMFSTNTLIGFDRGIKPYMECLQKICDEQDRKILFILQFSIDGPEEITDVSRNCPGITKNILKTIEDAAHWCAENVHGKFRVGFTTKPTVSPANWEYMLDNDKVYDWFKFFYDLSIKTGEIIKVNPNLEENLAQGPTICNPYEYSKRDGLLYRDFIRAIKKMDLSSMESRYNPYNLFVRYTTSWRDCIGAIKFVPGALLCSAGLGSVTVDYEGNLMTCHRLYDDWKMGTENFPAQAKLTQMMFNEDDIARVSYVSKTFFMNHELKQSLFDALIVSMVSSGEIDEKYLKPEWRHMAFILCGSQTCYAGECGLQSKGIYIPPMSLIRLLCNGALEEIVDYYEHLQ